MISDDCASRRLNFHHIRRPFSTDIMLCGLPIDGTGLSVNKFMVPRIYCWFVVRCFALVKDECFKGMILLCKVTILGRYESYSSGSEKLWRKSSDVRRLHSLDQGSALNYLEAKISLCTQMRIQD